MVLIIIGDVMGQIIRNFDLHKCIGLKLYMGQTTGVYEVPLKLIFDVCLIVSEKAKERSHAVSQ